MIRATSMVSHGGISMLQRTAHAHFAIQTWSWEGVTEDIQHCHHEKTIYLALHSNIIYVVNSNYKRKQNYTWSIIQLIHNISTNHVTTLYAAKHNHYSNYDIFFDSTQLLSHNCITVVSCWLGVLKCNDGRNMACTCTDMNKFRIVIAKPEGEPTNRDPYARTQATTNSIIQTYRLHVHRGPALAHKLHDEYILEECKTLWGRAGVCRGMWVK